jgi:hypothetical protein
MIMVAGSLACAVGHFGSVISSWCWWLFMASPVPSFRNSRVRNCEFRNALMGVAAKDASHLDIADCKFVDNGTNIALYVKKPFYPQPKVTRGDGVEADITLLGYRPE